MRRHYLSVFLLILVMMVPCVRAEGYDELQDDLLESDGFYYTLKADDTAEVYSWSNYDGGLYDLYIPETLDGHRVTSISSQGNFYGNETYTVTIPDCLTEIPVNPFTGLYELTQINVSPDHPSLASIEGVLYSKSDKRLVSYPRGVSWMSFSVPDGIKTIGENAFMCARYLEELFFPDSLEAINAHAFDSCELLELTLPESIKMVGDHAFSFCNELKTVEIQGINVQLGDYAFQPCGSLRGFYVSPDATELASIDGVLYNKAEKCLIDYPAGNGLQSFTVPEGIQTIGEHAFFSCYDLFMISLPESCTCIKREAFTGCDSLNTIELPNTLTTIEDYAFSGCGFSRIWLPESVVEVGANPFINCYQLIEIQVSPESERLATIDNVLFDKKEKALICYPCELSYTTYEIPEGIIRIGNFAFPASNYLELIIIPETVTSIDESALEYLYCKIRVTRDSYAAKYCKEHNLDYEYTNANDWLNS